ncbi:MAG: RDD family protein [Actinomycetota bacterium]|nr:RDD family protein [Actinomycetota bacterium]
MELEDKVTITTAEGVTLELPLAGVGSRAIAALVDTAIKGLLTIGVIAALAGGTAALDALGGSGTDGDGSVFVAIALAFVAIFLVNFGYDVLFETLASGRTPGKRWTGLRVVRAGGGPISFVPSAVRNLVRIVDALPGAYAIGLIAILVSSKNQRLGDMAAGTLVVRKRSAAAQAPAWATVRVAAEPPGALDVSAITGEELATVRAFLDRRPTLTADARSKLAWELAERLKPRVGGVPGEQHPEVFLEQIAAAKAATG